MIASARGACHGSMAWAHESPVSARLGRHRRAFHSGAHRAYPPATMTFKPWTFLTVAIAGWMNRQQQEVIEYLQGGEPDSSGEARPQTHHPERVPEAPPGDGGHEAGQGPAAPVRDAVLARDTLLRWHRWFVARKYDGSDRRGKRGPVPTKANMIRKLVLEMAEANPSLGIRPHPRRAQGPGLQRLLADRPAGHAGPRPAARSRQALQDHVEGPSSRATGRASPPATSFQRRGLGPQGPDPLPGLLRDRAGHPQGRDRRHPRRSRARRR